MMTLATRKYLRLLPAIYFVLLAIFSIAMEVSHNQLSLVEFCLYAAMLLPILIPVKIVWTLFGLILSFVAGLCLLNGFIWFIQYLNGSYFRYPFETFAIGFPFILTTLLCALSLCYTGLTSRHTFLLRILRG
jgi:hypothetical protein